MGHGCDKDSQEAIENYHLSAKNGNVQAMANLGYMYFKKGRLNNDEE